jgi:hypothetical protein
VAAVFHSAVAADMAACDSVTVLCARTLLMARLSMGMSSG